VQGSVKSPGFRARLTAGRALRCGWAACAAMLWLSPPARALDSNKSLTQYSRTAWTQEHGLPQDTVRAITQTTDGYLWLGTDEGLARFDGYEFVVFSKSRGQLPADSVTALAPGRDGSLWIGTPSGLVHYRDRQFRTFLMKDGLPDDSIAQVFEDREGSLWVVAGASLCRYRDGHFAIFNAGEQLPMLSVRLVREDSQGALWVVGIGAAGKFENGSFRPVFDPKILGDFIPTGMLPDRSGNIWLGGTTGIIERTGSGAIRRYGASEGLPDPFVRAMWEDRDGNIWAGTNGGLARLDGNTFKVPSEDRHGSGELVRCLFEDRDGDLWVGASSGLTRFRDTAFTPYGRSEGLPSDEANVVFQDRAGNIWVGFHDSGLMLFAGAKSRLFTTRDGLPNNEVFSIRQARNGDLLVAARDGMARFHDGRFTVEVLSDALGKRAVFDTLEDSEGRLWMGSAGGLYVKEKGRVRSVIPFSPLLANGVVTLAEVPGGALWAGTYGRGLWRIEAGRAQLFSTAEGLPSDQIRCLYPDAEGTLWIGTFGGGLASYRDGRFRKFNAADGLLSDNIADIADDGESLWLSTTRGICRIARRQLQEFAAGSRKTLEPVNYGVADGLRSAQCSPGVPAGGGGHATRDGRIWFTTSRGLAVWDPKAPRRPLLAPAVQLVDATVDGKPFDLARSSKLGPNAARVQFRYVGIHLSAPERVRYSYRLNGLDRDWVRAGARRTINFNSLAPGQYVFAVRAELPEGPVGERTFPFEVIPAFYQTVWFRLLLFLAVLAAAAGIYRLRLQQIRLRFALVLDERVRLAREIHDTLAQGFVGISSQLDAVAMCMPDETSPARKYLDLARRMARHSLTEARRSVMDLRASALEGQSLPEALEAGTRHWTAGTGVALSLTVEGEPGKLPEETEQHLLRIAQEAVHNVLKHASAHHIWIKLQTDGRALSMQVKDDGRGFEVEGALSAAAGRFGLLGIRERAERLGGELSLASHPGEGTQLEVRVPLP
jgi:signal transduction histidine kinase/ligand-binding sensor domain-containing protein